MVKTKQVDQFEQLIEDVIHLARFGAEGRARDVKALARKMSVRYRPVAPAASEELARISANGGMLRKARRPLPVDADSRMSLARVYDPGLADEPVLPIEIGRQIQQIVDEHSKPLELQAAGLSPVRTALFTGPPGVGKTMAARSIASSLGRSLVVLDLASSISSFLGKTGQNLRSLLDYAKEFECVLMLDEVDAIAKRRADESDLGELKRLVNVLLQELDEWPEGSLLLAATNHPDLLDPAVWRRFDCVVQFPLPEVEQREELLRRIGVGWDSHFVRLVSEMSDGLNHSDLVSLVQRARKTAILSKTDEFMAVLTELAGNVHHLPRAKRHQLSTRLSESGISQRQVSEITGTSRNTLRKNGKEAKPVETE